MQAQNVAWPVRAFECCEAMLEHAEKHSYVAIGRFRLRVSCHEEVFRSLRSGMWLMRNRVLRCYASR